jgi:hypothetical protein
MEWFGAVKERKWVMDVKGVVKQVGLGILRNYKVGVPCVCIACLDLTG